MKKAGHLSQLLLQFEMSMEPSSSQQGSLLRSFGKNFFSDGRRKNKEGKTKNLLHSNVNHRQNEKSAYVMEENIFKLCIEKGILIYKICKELRKHNSKNLTNQ